MKKSQGMGLTLASILMVTALGCTARKTHYVHDRLVEVIRPDYSWSECDSLREKETSYYGYFNSDLEEWVYPRTIDSEQFQRDRKACSRSRTRHYEEWVKDRRACNGCMFSPSVYYQLEDILFRAAQYKMSAKEKTNFIIRELNISRAEYEEIVDTERVPHSVLMKVVNRLGCSYHEAQALAEMLIP